VRHQWTNGSEIRDVYDQRISYRATLGDEDAPERVRVCRVSSEAVDRLGWKGNESAAAQAGRCPFDEVALRMNWVDANDLHHAGSVYFGYSDPMQAPLPFEAQSPDREMAPSLYFVRHRLARRYLVRVEPTGRVRVTIPRGGSRREAESFVVRQKAWIARQLLRLPSGEQRFTAEDRQRLQARAATELPAELHRLATRHNLTVTRVSIRNQRSRWGSCGRNGHITLNWRLIAMPEWVREYVLVHELMHLRRLDHSPEYWGFVAEACPDHLKARAWLRVHGSAFA
jgi:predicted metal-dependent hydrolase